MLRLGSVCAHPDPAGGFPEGVGWNRSPGAGFEIADVFCMSPAWSEPFEGQLPQFSPEQICLDVGRIQARALLAWASVLRTSY